MAVSTEHTKDVLIGDGVNTSFPFSFQVIEKEQVQCLKVLPTGEEIELLDTEFNIKLTNDGANGGEVTYPLVGDPLEEGYKFIVYRKTDIKQDYMPPNGQIFDAVAIKNEVDRLTMISQEQEESLSRSVKVPISDTQTPEELLAEVYNKLDSATEIAGTAIEAANNATSAAENATAAVASAEQTLENVTAYVDNAKTDIAQTVIDAKADIARTVTTAQDDIAQTILDAVDDVKSAAVAAAEETIADASVTVTNNAKVNLDEYVSGTVEPSLQQFVDAAGADAEASAESASTAANVVSGFDAHAAEKQSAFDANAAEKQSAVDASATAAAQSAAEALNRKNETSELKESAEASAAEATNQAEISRKYAQGTEEELPSGSAKVWAEKAEGFCNRTEVQPQSPYVDIVEMDSAVILAQDKKCWYRRMIAANDSFTIDLSAMKNITRCFIIDLIIVNPDALPFDLSQILPLGEGETADENKKWLNKSTPDLSEAGEHWVALFTMDGGQTWRASYEGAFAV